jgi:hypothetical protein
MPAGAEVGLDATPPRSRVEKKKRAGWIVPVVVIGALAVAGAVTVGVILGTQATGAKPLSGDLGTFPFDSTGFK